MDKDAAYLLSIEPNRFASSVLFKCRLPTKEMCTEGGRVRTFWSYPGSLSLGLRDDVCFHRRQSFKQKVDYIVDELEKCQQARKTDM